jgi:hypothetical protein
MVESMARAKYRKVPTTCWSVRVWSLVIGSVLSSLTYWVV